ncbi:Por secretion system C-terminal sorting domain-containing protein [Tenacibaculum sp. MAR_2009_124]|uniref:DUF6923 family protein n=1 Tax=Tenacibaculum sp. MAR_2009_124 TaxID=1250059 RepID=UPI00089CB534|nr:T9SS type A sorting domain-containing protein [Tenacibaculum sp. MAR_2009_124]SEB50548.1 Por secretion system C-terminal sorting domain-containing protein [Tenacibaculum sp. MAR_2009_124]
MNKYLPVFIAIFFFTSSSFYSQSQPFNCVEYAYLFQYNDVYSINLASGNATLVGVDITDGSINASGYNSADGYIWGSLSTPSKSIVRIGDDFSTDVYTINELPTSNRYIGDINLSGHYYLKPGGDTYYIIDLDPASPNYLTSLGTGTLSTSLSIHDWAFNSLDNFIYAVEKGTNILYRINSATGNVDSLGEVPILSGFNYTYGAVYFDNVGNFYVSSNQTGTVYIIYDVTNITSGGNITSNLFAYGPSSSSNDGARCPTAPVPMEDCSNGVDDDGDGLVDCDDPSCSGVESCPTIDPSTSGGNEGGLESNNRLAEQISKRNFKRLKTNYSFQKAKAKRLKKTNSYGKSKRNQTISLEDFIPLATIDEDETIESTPTDLLNITNATEVFSVDYLRDNSTIASILALKTENSVYEHSKYICDRLLGAELLSVSTVEINEHNFIRSIIKNSDGNTEFVASFSAKIADTFEIENHWNLDKYSQESDFYNFQIWSNSIDDLVKLCEEILVLLETQKNISSYALSAPPTVFVKSGSYKDGELDLTIVNSNNTDSVEFNAGYRSTETSNIEHVTSNIALNNNYLSNIHLETGNLFDIGFRIGDGTNTPDDLFMSDGPWGIDDAASSTQIESFLVSPNEVATEFEEMAIERNIELVAETEEYISIYKAFTARFKPIDISEYNTLSFNASGSGTLQVRFIKNNIDVWEEQYSLNIQLEENTNQYTLPLNQFSTEHSGEPIFNDVTMLVFTKTSSTGERQEVNISVSEIKLSKSALSVDEYDVFDGIAINPNPMTKTSTLSFNGISPQSEADLVIYNQLGQMVQNQKITISTGKNEIKIHRNNISSGIYFISVNTLNGCIIKEKLVIK